MAKMTQNKENTERNSNNNDNPQNKTLLSLPGWLRFPLSSLWAVIAGMAIGIAPLVYSNFISEPKLEGRIITIATGEGYSPDGKPSTDATTHTVFLCIANKRNIPVPIIDYSLNLEYEDGSTQTSKPIYIKTKSFTLGFNEFEIVIPTTEQYLLNKVNALVTPQNPISGFISFIEDRKLLRSSKLKVATITLIDGFGNSHKIKTLPSDFSPPNLLTFLINGCEFKKLK